jgi:hypothetical protein
MVHTRDPVTPTVPSIPAVKNVFVDVSRIKDPEDAVVGSAIERGEPAATVNVALVDTPRKFEAVTVMDVVGTTTSADTLNVMVPELVP